MNKRRKNSRGTPTKQRTRSIDGCERTCQSTKDLLHWNTILRMGYNLAEGKRERMLSLSLSHWNKEFAKFHNTISGKAHHMLDNRGVLCERFSKTNSSDRFFLMSNNSPFLITFRQPNSVFFPKIRTSISPEVKINTETFTGEGPQRVDIETNCLTSHRESEHLL